MPTPRPRYLSRITSPISTAPAAHSPPKPSPCSARNIKSCSKFCANAQRKVKIEYQTIVICSIRTRPNRSAKVPENHPPKDEIRNVTVPIQAGLATRQTPRRDHRRDHKAVHLHVERTQRPAAETGAHRPAFFCVQFAEPGEHRVSPSQHSPQNLASGAELTARILRQC